MITVLLDPDRFAGAEAAIDGDAYRHLFRARRAAVGDRLRAVDGLGRARWAEVTAVGRSAATVTLGDPAPSNEPAHELTLLVAALRRERASWLVEKATELGVTAIRFLASERTPREFGGGTLGRLGRVAVAAVEQCHRARIPDISGVHPWSEVPDLLAAAGPGPRWVLDTDPTTSLRDPRESSPLVQSCIGEGGGSGAWTAGGEGLPRSRAGGLRPSTHEGNPAEPGSAPPSRRGDPGLQQATAAPPTDPGPQQGAAAPPNRSEHSGSRQPPTAPPSAIVIGPEGGWTDAERAELAAAGCIVVSIGARVLRVETAALAAATLALAPPWPSG